jgi:uncharacterized repeat protein (TIGR03803 family)
MTRGTGLLPRTLPCRTALIAAAATLILLLGVRGHAAAQAYQVKTVAYFNGANGATGDEPAAGLIADGKGDYYGTTESGGATGTGTIFEYSASGGLRTLAAFNALSTGYIPCGDLLTNGNGTFYGTTQSGGTYGDGTIYQYSASGGIQTLASFNGINGAVPHSDLVMDGSGNLYAAVEYGGPGWNPINANGWGNGTIVKWSASGGLQAVVTFNGTNGANPVCDLLPDGHGGFYGTTTGGGPYYPALSAGALFDYSDSGGLQIITSFPLYENAQGIEPGGANDTAVLQPYGPLVPDGKGGFYGYVRKLFADGVVYLCDYLPSGGIQLLAAWDTASPTALISDGHGGVYGTTQWSSLYPPTVGDNNGNFFEYSPSTGFQTLATFNGADGSYPLGLVPDGEGDFYGTTQAGGIGFTGMPGTGAGTIFELVPASVPEPPASLSVIAMGCALALARVLRLRRHA